MRPDLYDAEAAIDWAMAQLPVLQERIDVWMDDKPYSVRIDTDSEPGKKVYRLCNVKNLPPIVNAEAGAIIHSIRSSLDLMACALAARNGFPDSETTYFPIWKDETAFLAPPGRQSNPTLKKIERLSERNQGVIKSLLPYKGGNDLLWSLHDLDVTRKHRRLLDTFIFSRGIEFTPGLHRPVISHWGGFKDEAVLVTTGADQPDSQINIGLNVAFDEAGPLHGKSFTATIRNFASMAKNILVLFCPRGA
jgi:hypothetical protein